jgi:ABC-type transport system involved in multi-copper enzyme maturation permease subunit
VARGAARRRAYLTPLRALVALDMVTAVTAFAPYVAVAAVAAITGLVLQNDLYRIDQDGLLVIAEPFALPLYFGTLLLVLYQATSVTIAVARDREQGAMELLFSGPVDARTYLVAKMCSSLLLYCWLAVLTALCYLLFTVATGLRLGATASWALVLSVSVAAAATGLALAVAAAIRRLRAAVLTVLALAVLAIGFQIVADVMARLPAPDFHVSPLHVVRLAASGISAVTGWVLPFSYLDRGLAALGHGDMPGYIGTLFACGLYAMAMLGMAVFALDKTGVRR